MCCSATSSIRPRGRIYLIKDMLESERPATTEVVTHIDRCLSCLACMTTCPSGVDYMHLVDHAARISRQTYRRPLVERLLRAALAAMLPDRAASGRALGGARAAVRAAVRQRRPRRGSRPCCDLAPGRLPARSPRSRPGIFRARRAQRPRGAPRRLRRSRCWHPNQRGDDPPAQPRRCRGGAGRRRGLLRCARPSHGPRAAGAAPGARQHRRLDRRDRGRRARRHPHHHVGLRHDGEGLRLSCCATTRPMPRRPRASPRLPRTSRSISRPELRPPVSRSRPTSPITRACSLQHGQKIRRAEGAAVPSAGFEVRESRKAHLCCGSAGTYNMLQPEIADPAARPQGREHRGDRARRDRRRQYRLRPAR